MSKTKIEWTDYSWNPIRARNKKTGKVGWHCEHATIGCHHCYSESINLRLGTGLPFKPGHRKDIELFLDDKMLSAPERWRKSRMIFVCSMTDLFADFVPEGWLRAVFATMARTPQHTYQVLTKRSKRARELLSRWQKEGLTLREGCGAVLPNVWIGASVERQQEADERIPDLLATPAAVRFLSAEPLLGPINLTRINYGGDEIDALQATIRLRTDSGEKHIPFSRHPSGCLSWVIAGGESGTRARPMHPEWARSLRDQCQAAGVAFFFKQWGAWHADALLYTKAVTGECPPPNMRVGKKAAGRLLDGRTWDEMPA